ncbi:biliverdin-producing heme oxygenase [Pseudomonas huanghezhanensis]|uniref:biliverdin-producing heme oxygenase n=1 Tax=Pseudomonas huanghezhanensis TaxID=3002903 RepID=UPI0038B4387B
MLVATHGQPVLQRLREATGQSHKSLEDRLPFMRAELDRGLYVRLIQAYYGFYQPLERVIAELPADSPTAHQRFKVPALLRDLTALGMSQAQIDALPFCVELPSLRSPHRLLGTRYVIEGATLGGQVLRRVIKDKLGIEADCGAEFLDVYGRSTGPLWKAFLTDLAQADDPAHNDQVVDAACETFRCFEQWLDKAQVLSA